MTVSSFIRSHVARHGPQHIHNLFFDSRKQVQFLYADGPGTEGLGNVPAMRSRFPGIFLPCFARHTSHMPQSLVTPARNRPATVCCGRVHRNVHIAIWLPCGGRTRPALQETSRIQGYVSGFQTLGVQKYRGLFMRDVGDDPRRERCIRYSVITVRALRLMPARYFSSMDTNR